MREKKRKRDKEREHKTFPKYLEKYVYILTCVYICVYINTHTYITLCAAVLGIKVLYLKLSVGNKLIPTSIRFCFN